jgi:hypothetical protein
MTESHRRDHNCGDASDRCDIPPVRHHPDVVVGSVADTVTARVVDLESRTPIVCSLVSPKPAGDRNRPELLLCRPRQWPNDPSSKYCQYTGSEKQPGTGAIQLRLAADPVRVCRRSACFTPLGRRLSVGRPLDDEKADGGGSCAVTLARMHALDRRTLV